MNSTQTNTWSEMQSNKNANDQEDIGIVKEILQCPTHAENTHQIIVKMKDRWQFLEK